jgi:transcriptional regulator with XRE-family HTH domain
MANLTPQGCRAARGLVNWSVRELGAKCGISGESISAFENGRPMRESNKAAVIAALEAEGIEILNGDAPGARMRPRGSLGEG